MKKISKSDNNSLKFCDIHGNEMEVEMISDQDLLISIRNPDSDLWKIFTPSDDMINDLISYLQAIIDIKKTKKKSDDEFQRSRKSALGN